MDDLKEREKFYKENFYFATFTDDFTDKVGLISLLNYLYRKLLPKNPNLTQFTLLKKIYKDNIPDKCLQNIALMSESLGEGCKTFPVFGIKDKDIPKKIKELLDTWIPF